MHNWLIANSCFENSRSQLVLQSSNNLIGPSRGKVSFHLERYKRGAFDANDVKLLQLNTHTQTTIMNVQEILFAITALAGLFFAVPVMAADENGDGIPDDQQ